MLRRLRALLALSLLSTGAVLASPGAALADCMPPPPLEAALKTAEFVFIGTVDSTAQGNRWASVTVTEIWRGPDVGKTVLVKGGPEGNAATSVDRFFEVGLTYIFFPYVDAEGGGLADNSCTNTQQWSQDMAALRPADARTPIDEEETAGQGGVQLDDLLPFVLVGVVFVVLLGIGLVARGRSEA